MSRLLVLLVGLLALSLPIRASFIPGVGDNSVNIVLAIFTGSDPTSSQLAVPPIAVSGPSGSTCYQAPITYSALIPALSHFKINPVTATTYELSFGCQSPATSCVQCAYTLPVITAGNDTLTQWDEYWVMIYNENAAPKTMTTYLYTDPACSAFVWPSTPLTTTSGACKKSDYFTGLTGDATFWNVWQLEAGYYSIAAACDSKCQSCNYGGIGILLPGEGANNCTNIVLSPFYGNPDNYTFYAEAEVGQLKEWNNGRVVTVAIGVGAAAVLVLVSIVVVIRSLKAPGYRPLN